MTPLGTVTHEMLHSRFRTQWREKRVYIASDHERIQFTMDDLNAVEKYLLRGEYPRQLHEGGEGQP